MSYQWMGDDFMHIRYNDEVDKNFKWIKYTAPHKEPLFTTVEISTEGYIKIDGKQTEWEGPSPWEVNYPEDLEVTEEEKAFYMAKSFKEAGLDTRK